MQSDLEKRIESALGAILQHIPETKQEASRMTTEQWKALQDAASMCGTVHSELAGLIYHNGTWVHVGRKAAKLVNNANYAIKEQI